MFSERSDAVTECEWLGYTDPTPMLKFVRGKASDRKLRLFACTCARRVWRRTGEASLPEEIGASERCAEGETSKEELRAIRSRLGSRGRYSAAWAANNALHAVLEEGARDAAELAVVYAADFVHFFTAEQKGSTDSGVREEAVAREAELLELTAGVHDIFGNPFRPARIDPAWLAWNAGTVVGIAQAIYDDRAFDQIPILADALEEAGCDNVTVLDHLRSPGPHVRGCWVVDLVLGKE